MKTKVTRFLCTVACAAAVMIATQAAQAANWLMLQGTEKPNAAPRAKVWGFIQPEYQYTKGTELEAGPWAGTKAVFNQVRPDLKASSGFNVIRARVGVRGQPLPLDANVNYFFLAEFGNNGITRQGGGSAKITDASITLSHIPGARIRVGQFKTPGAEEGLQAIHVFDYINFTNVTNMLLLERYFDTDGSATGPAATSPNKPNGPVSAFRDIGVQVFDAFQVGSWELSYAAMYGNGNGITRGDNDDNREFYGYLSAEWLLGGRGAKAGPRRNGWKMFGWVQNGKRTIVDQKGNTSAADDTLEEFDRKRWGIGTTFRYDRWRAGFEYVAADGMIFAGSDGGAVPGTASTNTAPPPPPGTISSWNVQTEEKADGFYVDFGYYIFRNKWVIDFRYDRLNRGTEVDANERRFQTLTLGTQFFFNRKSRVLLNYEFRRAEAPNLPSTDTANRVLDSMDDRVAVQFLTIF